MAETYEELEEEIQKMFSKAEDVKEVWDTIWPAAMRCETFFRNSNDIRALQLQAGHLMQMESSIYRGAYLTDAYAVCRRILEIDPNNEGAKHAIEDHIIPHWKDTLTRNPDVWKNNKDGNIPRATRQEIESMLEKYFNERKDDNYDYFLDDIPHKLKVEGSNDSDDWDGFDYSSKGTRY